MKPDRIAHALIVAVLLSLLTTAGTAESADLTGWERYSILAERNIFSRDRWKPAPLPGESVPLPPPAPERYVVLTGIVKQGGEYTAFLEDIRTGVTDKAKIGDAVIKGRVKNVALDRIEIEYEKDARTTVIHVGMNLEGGESITATAYLPSPDTGSFDLAPAAAAGSGAKLGQEAEDEVLERLRQRREKELEK